ncbi:transglycosylase SLT domain-containing protein [Methylomonas sp. BW4-1]|uniref:transglycosylase SLT domain-containing protein n=1 Tax=Methylomonas sp. BW4-1 TaxID=3376685 RepID=UPI004042707E
MYSHTIDKTTLSVGLKKSTQFHGLIAVLLTILSGSICQTCVANENSQHRQILTQSKPNQGRLHNTLWAQVAKRHQLDPYVLYAVALVESRKDDAQNQSKPWPWAINHAGKAIIPKSKQEAVNALNQLLESGERSVDVGMMQVNLRWHGHRVAKPENLLDPRTNLDVGASLLAEAMQSAPENRALGVGRYYSWKNRQAAIEYGQKVIALAEQLRFFI